MFKSGQEALPNVQEWPGVVGRHSQISESGRETLPDVWDCPEMVGRPFRMSGYGLEALTNVREWSGSPL